MLHLSMKHTNALIIYYDEVYYMSNETAFIDDIESILR